jgi:signal transduction histidine kinase
VLAEAARARRLAVGTVGVGAGRVVGHPEQLAHAVHHLLDNAARHGATRVEVALHAATAPDHQPETDAAVVGR